MAKGLFLIAATVGALYLSRNEARAAVSDESDFNRWDSLFHQASRRYGVPWRWMKAICIIESSLGQAESVATGLREPSNVEDSVSEDGLSWGLMQVTLKTANALRPGTTSADLNVPEISVDLAGQLLSQLIHRFGLADRQSVVRAYNGGPSLGSTAAAKARTLAYYGRFLTALQVVQSKQPGKDDEIA